MHDFKLKINKGFGKYFACCIIAEDKKQVQFFIISKLQTARIIARCRTLCAKYFFYLLNRTISKHLQKKSTSTLFFPPNFLITEFSMHARLAQRKPNKKIT